MHPVAKWFATYMGKVTFIRFLMLVWMWFKFKRWLKTCNDPLKIAIIEVMIIGAHMGLRAIDWWVPKLPPSIIVGNIPDIGEVGRAAAQERRNVNIGSTLD